MRRALITGITGQDGSYLADHLLVRGYEVHGIIRRSSSFNTGRIDHIFDRLHLHHGDVTDGSGLSRLLVSIQPEEIYHLAAQSHVRVSFDIPEYTADTVALGTIRLLEAVRDICPEARVYQASSSEMFGSAQAPQSEHTPFQPRSPYACAKVHAFWAAVNARDGYGLHVSNGILFNHESPRRGETFVSRKVCKAAARIRAGKQQRLALGNLQARRDWGWAPEYVEAMWLMLQQPQGGDYVIATGVSHTVEELVDTAFAVAGLDWRGYVDIDRRLFRPTEVDDLRGDATKAGLLLGWQAGVSFEEMIRRMVEAEIDGRP
jgi:GDPmannose 4,6-dehydratase